MCDIDLVGATLQIYCAGQVRIDIPATEAEFTAFTGVLNSDVDYISLTNTDTKNKTLIKRDAIIAAKWIAPVK